MKNSMTNVASTLNLNVNQVQTTIKLLNEGATVPFIARYRKQLTGGLDEEQIEHINQMFTYNQELLKRQEAIIKILKEKELLDKQLEENILATTKKSDLEAIYAPYKNGKKTKADEAIALGLKPLAESIFSSIDQNFNPMSEARKYVSDKLPSIDKVIEKARLIIAQFIAQDLETRKYVKEQLFNFGFIKTKLKKDGRTLDEREIFKNYYDAKEKISKIPNHRIMAINRGINKKIISISFEYKKEKILYDLSNKYFKIKTTGKIIRDSLIDSLKRLIIPSVERQIWTELFERAQKASINNFSNSLEKLLLAPAVKGKMILAIDPAFVSGCKLAVISPEGKRLDIAKIYPNKPMQKTIEASNKLNEILRKHKIDVIVIGNGTASRETEAFVEKYIKSSNIDIPYYIVSEVGASVYSASKNAIEEFPDLSVEERSAISIGRMYQDPLNELVKIDPKSIGVGQYQHDVNQKELAEALKFKTEKVVNQVGVDVNTATKEILTYISGLSKSVAKNIIELREENGVFKSRKDLKKVKGLGLKAYEQAVGFIRIHNSVEPLDATSIHPESYQLTKKICKYLNIDLNNIDSNAFDNVDINELVEKFETNKYDVKQIFDSLLTKGKDIRDKKDGLVIDSKIKKFEEVTLGMQLFGTVQNITDFGVFVYIGIKEAVFVHISNMTDKFVKSPYDIVSPNEVIELEIIQKDNNLKRLQGKILNK